MFEVSSGKIDYTEVAHVDLSDLKELVKKDEQIYARLWHELSYRIIIMNKKKVDPLAQVSREKIRMLCQMCDFTLGGDELNTIGGGVVVQGSLKIGKNMHTSGV